MSTTRNDLDVQDKRPEDILNRLSDDMNALEVRFENRIHSLSQRTLAFPKITFLVLFVLFLLFIYFVHEQNNRITLLKSSLTEAMAIEVQKGQAHVMPSEAVLNMTNKLSYLELRQNAVLDEAKNSMERLYFVFATVAAFFGLFSLYFGYRQIVVESKRDESRDTNDQEMRNLVRSFQNNITTISSLISTLEQSFAYRKEIEEQLNLLGGQTKALEMEKAETDASFHALISELNAEAVKMFSADIDRANLSLEENRNRMKAFASKLTNVEERKRDVRNQLNPFCYYIRGLSYIGNYEYELAIDDFEISHKKGKIDMADLRLDNYAEQDRENIRELVNKMLVSSSYFEGVGYKNLGKYYESRSKFQEALDRNPRHLQSRTYLMQVMFFDMNIPFEAIEVEYEKAIQDLKILENSDDFDKERLRRAFNTLKINQGSMYLKKEIPFEFRAGYKRYESPDKAMKCFWDAYDKLDNDLAMFAVAQAMEHVGASAWRGHTPQEFYKKAMGIIKRRIAEDPDRLYSIMLYYMLAICARKLNLGAESSEVFLSQARHSLKEVPRHVTYYSPINRIRLNPSQLLEEMEIFERAFK